jgi:uncharacterized protein YhaN
MKIRDIQIDGFGVWTGLTVDSLPESMAVFYGPNEAGKTTLMQFLRAMFYGFPPERRQRYLPPVHGGRPGGALRVTGPGGGYEVSRRATLDDQSVQGQVTVSGSDGVIQGAHRLGALLGQIDESIFSNVFAIGIRELQELSSLDDTAAADELYKLSSGMDRVSLVDIIRQLKQARNQIVGTVEEPGFLAQALQRRDKLRHEQEVLLAKGKRWTELAATRQNQQEEIDSLYERLSQWEVELKGVDLAISMKEPWIERDRIREQIAHLKARIDLPDDAVSKVKQLINSQTERQTSIDQIKQQRRQLRAKAASLPIRRAVLEHSAKIEAAAEQSPWIASLQKQIQRLQADVQQARDHLMEDARRLGLSDEDQQLLLRDQRLANLPDLSRQAIADLAVPAREVRIQSARLAKAKAQTEDDRAEAEKLKRRIDDFLAVREQTDLTAGMHQLQELIQKLRSRQEIDERIEKLQKHRRELQEEAVDLEAEDALPLERFFVLMIPYAIGAVMLLIGLDKLLTNFFFDHDVGNGSLLSLVGMVTLFFWWTWKSFTERGTDGSLDDCESQLDAVIRQLKKSEVDREELDRSIPSFTGNAQQRIKECEHELSLFETLLPVQQNLEAALQRLSSAEQTAHSASVSLHQAKTQWRKTLQHLGLSESLSPKSLRLMADGYESLVTSRRRLKTHEDELAQRSIEWDAFCQRIDSLHRSMRSDSIPPAASPAPASVTRDPKPNSAAVAINNIAAGSGSSGGAPSATPVAQIDAMVDLLGEQRSLLQNRRQWKEEDQTLAKQQRSMQASVDKLERSIHAMLADWGVESVEQLEEQQKGKQEHLKLAGQLQGAEQRIRSMLAGHVPYDTMAQWLSPEHRHELEKRWESLTHRMQQARSRVDQLLQRQGEVSQEMKTLASDRRLAEVQLEMATLEKQIQVGRSRWKTLAATHRMLEQVCEVYETQRQPETLREASGFLKQLTGGKYTRIWTQLGKNQLRIDNQSGQALPLEVLSRGTREAVFIALRLALASAFSRRGVAVPLVLDDVLVNFDSHRAQLAAQVLKDFAAMGHQVIMFTCHEHIMRMFHQIGVQVRVLPVQGEPGEAKIYQPQPPVQKALPEPEILEPIAEQQPEEPAVEDDSLWFDFENREDRWIPLEVLEEDIRHSRKVPAGWHVDNANDAGHNEAAGTRR